MTQRVTAELRGLRDLPYGTARTAATETIARRVEAEGPPEALAEALLDLVEAYTFSGCLLYTSSDLLDAGLVAHLGQHRRWA